MANDSRIGILIEAKASTAAIGQTRQELLGLDQAAGIAAGGLSGLASALGTAGLLALAGAAVGTVFSLAETAAQAGRTRSAFDNLAEGVGQSADGMLADMQRASDGMVSNVDLVQSANRAMLLGVADSGEELGQLLEVARVRGAAMGLSVQQAFNDLVTGLGRMSPLILDNLGIVTGGEAVFNRYAESLGRTAGSLTDAEKKQALFNKVVAETNDLIARQGDSAQQDLAAPFERMGAALANAKQALGELFGPAVAGVAQLIADAATTAAAAVTEMGNAAALSAAKFDFVSARTAVGNLETDILRLRNALDLATPGTDVYKQIKSDLLDLQRQLRDTESDLRKNQQILGAEIDANNGAAQAVALHAERLQDLAGAAGLAAPAITNLGNRVAVGSDHLRDGAAAALEMRDAINQLASSAAGRLSSVFSGASDLLGGGSAAFGEFERINSGLQTQINLWEQAGKSADEIGFLVDAWIRTQSDSFSDQRAAMREAERGATSYGSTLSQAASSAASEFDDLKSKVAGVLSGARGDIAGINLDELLPREDAVAENARRLADIAVNGFKGQDWLGEFASAVPDVFKIISESGDPKAAAANVLRDFQAGLVPELIDKERAKDLVRRMILGEQQADTLAAEIAAELAAEFGAGAPADLNALVSQALGGGGAAAAGTAGAAGGAQAGTDAAQSFASSFATAASGVGAQIAASLKVDSVIALIKDAGKAAGEGWGEMFLGVVGDHVPAALVDLLTNLVTPGVQAQLAQQQSLTGAR